MLNCVRMTAKLKSHTSKTKNLLCGKKTKDLIGRVRLSPIDAKNKSRFKPHKRASETTP